MKRVYLVMLLLITTIIVFSPQLLPFAIASVNSEPCQNGDHSLELVSQNYWPAYGGRQDYTVSSCYDVPYTHTHYHIIAAYNTCTYVCQTCGYTDVIDVPIFDQGIGSICTLNDNGR